MLSCAVVSNMLVTLVTPIPDKFGFEAFGRFNDTNKDVILAMSNIDVKDGLGCWQICDSKAVVNTVEPVVGVKGSELGHVENVEKFDPVGVPDCKDSEVWMVLSCSITKPV